MTQLVGKSGNVGYFDPRQLVEAARAAETAETYAAVNSSHPLRDFVS